MPRFVEVVQAGQAAWLNLDTVVLIRESGSRSREQAEILTVASLTNGLKLDISAKDLVARMDALFPDASIVAEVNAQIEEAEVGTTTE